MLLLGSIDSFPDVQTLVDTSTIHLPPVQPKIRLTCFQKTILAVVTVAVLVLLGVSTAMLFLMLHQNEDLRRIKGELSKLHYDAARLPESFDQKSVGDMDGSKSKTPPINKQRPGSGKVRDENNIFPHSVLEKASSRANQRTVDGSRGTWEFPFNENINLNPDDFSTMKDTDIPDWVELELSSLVRLQQSVCRICANHCHASNTHNLDTSTASKYYSMKAETSSESVTNPSTTIKANITNQNEPVRTLSGDTIQPFSQNPESTTEILRGTYNTISPESTTAVSYESPSATPSESEQHLSTRQPIENTKQRPPMTSDNASFSQQHNESTLTIQSKIRPTPDEPSSPLTTILSSQTLSGTAETTIKTLIQVRSNIASFCLHLSSIPARCVNEVSHVC